MTKRAMIGLLVVATLAGGVACTKVYNGGDRDGGLISNPIVPSNPCEQTVPRCDQVKTDTIEFRVTGNFSSVLVRHTNSLDGTSVIQTGLPWFFQITNTKDNVFLSLDVSATSSSQTAGTAFLNAQIFVNGVLFREVTSTSFAPAVSVNGTYRR